MELKQSWFADLCGVKRQTIQSELKSGKLIKSESGKLNVHDPANNRYLLDHGKSVLDAEKLLNEKNKSSSCRPIAPKKREAARNTDDDTVKLINTVRSVIIERYGEEEGKTVLNLIYLGVGKN